MAARLRFLKVFLVCVVFVLIVKTSHVFPASRIPVTFVDPSSNHYDDPSGTEPSDQEPDNRESVNLAPPYRAAAEKTQAGSEWHQESGSLIHDHTLTEEQCDAEFPALYHEIDRSVQFWEQNGRIRPDNIDLGWAQGGGVVRVMIIDKQLYIVEAKGATTREDYRVRTLATLQQINRAITTSREAIPDIEFSFAVGDGISDSSDNPSDSNSSIWAYTRKATDPSHDRLWLVPDFNLWSWDPVAGSFPDFQRQAHAYDVPLSAKKPQLIWRGALWVNEAIRGALIQQSQGQEWSDVATFDWNNQTEVAARRISMSDHCRYAFAAHTEGRTWSGRLKYLLQCRSVAVVHQLEWMAWYYHLLVAEGEEQNILLVDREWSNLQEKMEYYLAHEEEAQRVADNAAKLFRDRYLTPAAETCYWRRLFKGYASVAFTPDPYLPLEPVPERPKSWAQRLTQGWIGAGAQVEVEDKPEERRFRGITYEEYIIKEGNYPPDG